MKKKKLGLCTGYRAWDTIWSQLTRSQRVLKKACDLELITPFLPAAAVANFWKKVQQAARELPSAKFRASWPDLQYDVIDN